MGGLLVELVLQLLYLGGGLLDGVLFVGLLLWLVMLRLVTDISKPGFLYLILIHNFLKLFLIIQKQLINLHNQLRQYLITLRILPLIQS